VSSGELNIAQPQPFVQLHLRFGCVLRREPITMSFSCFSVVRVRGLATFSDVVMPSGGKRAVTEQHWTWCWMTAKLQ